MGNKEKKMMNGKTIVISMLLAFSLIAAGCGASSTATTRVAADTQTDLSGRWNDTDSRLVAEQMVSDLLSAGWLPNFVDENGAKPRVIVGKVRLKDSMEHIKTSGFIKDIERELVNSGRVSFVASASERDIVRDERMDQQSFASEESAKRLANEAAADYMLSGSITMYVDAVGGKQAKFYQIDMELINIESNEKVWLGSKEIKKIVQQRKASW